MPLVLLDARTCRTTSRRIALSRWLYGEDNRYRLAQEAVLGIGGASACCARSVCTCLGTYHLNRGHAAFTPPGDPAHGRNRAGARRAGFLSVAIAASSRRTHAVAAGHDRFERGMRPGKRSWELVPDEVLWMLGGREELYDAARLNLSHYVNGVAMRREVSARCFTPTRSPESRTGCTRGRGPARRWRLCSTAGLRAGATTRPCYATPWRSHPGEPSSPHSSSGGLYRLFRFRHYFPYLFRNGPGKMHPKELKFEITFRCNLRCVMCPLASQFDDPNSQIVQEWKREKELTTEEISDDNGC